MDVHQAARTLAGGGEETLVGEESNPRMIPAVEGEAHPNRPRPISWQCARCQNWTRGDTGATCPRCGSRFCETCLLDPDWDCPVCHPGLDSESDTEAGGVKGRKAVKEEEQAAEDEASQLVTVSYSTLQCRKAWGDKLCPSSPSEWGDLSISLSHLSVVTPGSASSGLSEAHSRRDRPPSASHAVEGEEHPNRPRSISWQCARCQNWTRLDPTCLLDPGWDCAVCHPGLDSESDTEVGGMKGRKTVKEEEHAAEEEASQPASDIQGDTPGSASSGLSEAHSRSGSAAPTCASLAQSKRKRLWAGASPELQKKRARGTRNYSFSGRSEDYTEMTLKALRDLADKTPGMKESKRRSSKSG